MNGNGFNSSVKDSLDNSELESDWNQLIDDFNHTASDDMSCQLKVP